METIQFCIVKDVFVYSGQSAVVSMFTHRNVNILGVGIALDDLFVCIKSLAKS